MGLNVEKTGAACGAFVTGVDLTQDLSDDLVGEIRAHWLENKVLAFPDQPMDDTDLERFTQYFGAFGKTRFSGILTGMKTLPPSSAMPMKQRRFLPKASTLTGAFSTFRPPAPACSGSPFPRSEAIRCLPIRWRPMNVCRTICVTKPTV